MLLATGVVLPPDPISTKFPNLGAVIGAALPYIYVIAGLMLLFNIVSGGITLMTAAGDQNATKMGYGKVTAGIIGFLIIFVAYFVTQIVETVFGVRIF
jgi:hypothetical protein